MGIVQKRNMSRLKLSKRYFRTGRPINNSTPEERALGTEFDDYQRKHYPTVPIECLCGGQKSYLISTTDRDGWEYPLVLCISCGLIRAKRYWDLEPTIDYYKNWYRKLHGTNCDDDPTPEHRRQVGYISERLYDFTKTFTKRFNKPYTVVDIGGSYGGALKLFRKEAKCYLLDYNKRFLQFARDQGIEAVEGGISKLGEVKIKPDLVILSQVLEHFTDVHKELVTLKSSLKIGSLVYVSLPGIDSLKLGRRLCDFLRDLVRAHVFYFSSETLNNLMGRHGFKCLRSDSGINALYEYTGIKEELINHHDIVVSHIRSAEFKRKWGYPRLRIFIGWILPHSFRDWIKNRFHLNIHDHMAKSTLK